MKICCTGHAEFRSKFEPHEIASGFRWTLCSTGGVQAVKFPVDLLLHNQIISSPFLKRFEPRFLPLSPDSSTGTRSQIFLLLDPNSFETLCSPCRSSFWSCSLRGCARYHRQSVSGGLDPPNNV
ncbi:hypothetical protein F2Q69_00035622 [Brassica cretica]|uniref:Uncharacterized protein n=1 Tax=Brassica cretica TaxID=69181 RepID=A0A8S9SJN3_BRACR|nr:hypothetical protein F2Q69_00035622 [Brassica cretica]